jgi:nucleoid-associated protein YgaU
MKIYYDNQGQLDDPDNVQVGQELTIPAKS